jgi:hypothetical protein
MMQQTLTSQGAQPGAPPFALQDLGNEAVFHFGWEALAHPAEVFGHPREVVANPRLSRAEKRAILASWASDACAVEAAPALRMLPGGKEPVLFDDVMDAIRAIDEEELEAA